MRFCLTIYPLAFLRSTPDDCFQKPIRCGAAPMKNIIPISKLIILIMSYWKHLLQRKVRIHFMNQLRTENNAAHIRKVEPLKRALAGNAVWITGLRAEHSPDRKDLPRLEWDETNQIIKYHPFCTGQHEEVKKYISYKQYSVQSFTRQRFCKHRLCTLYQGH